jgi:chromatin assembly factor 1 subunit B
VQPSQNLTNLCELIEDCAYKFLLLSQGSLYFIAQLSQLLLLDRCFAVLQGTAWDPCNEYIATQSNDRTCKTYSCKSKAKDGSTTGALVIKADRTIKAVVAPNNSSGSSAVDAASPASAAFTTPPLSAAMRKPAQPSKPSSASASATSSTAATPAVKGPASAVTPSPLSNVVVIDDNDKESEQQSTPAAATAPAAAAVATLATSATAQQLPQPGVAAGAVAAVAAAAVAPTLSASMSTPKQKRSLLFASEVDMTGNYFRRLAWTPDGAFLITPAAQCAAAAGDAVTGSAGGGGGSSAARFCTHMFQRGSFSA